MDNKDNGMSFKFAKVGSAIKFGMVHELPEIIRNRGEGSLIHFYAALTYLSLYNVIDAKVISKIPKILHVNIRFSNDLGNLGKIVEKIAKVLIEELKRKYEFSTFEEMTDILDKFTIPKWCFDFGKEYFIHYGCSAVLVNDELYFTGQGKFDSESCLQKIRTENVEDTDILESDNVEQLAVGYDEILGYDVRSKRIYLSVYDQENYYAYYDILSDKFVICKGRFVAIESGNLFVKTVDGYLAIQFGDSEHRIEKYDEDALYECKENYITVKPKKLAGKHFFKPYNMTFDGEKTKADSEECRRSLWQYLTNRLNSSTIGYDELEYSIGTIDMPKHFSISEIRDAVDMAVPSERRCRDKDYVLLKNTLEIIESITGDFIDVSNLLYALCEANSILSSVSGFPSEELYWRLREVKIENAHSDICLEKLVGEQQFSRLVNVLVNDNRYEASELYVENEDCANNDLRKSHDERIKNLLKRYMHVGKIGSFMVANENNEIKSTVIPLEKGMLIGSQIVPIVSLISESGIVSYDAKTSTYYVNCRFDINNEERLRILKDFELDYSKVLFVKQCLENCHRRDLESA